MPGDGSPVSFRAEESIDDLDGLRTSSCCWEGTDFEWDVTTGEGMKDGGHVISPDGAIGDEYRLLKQAEAAGLSVKATPAVRDPYHGRLEEPRFLKEPKRETFNVMVVGESGLGKTTLLESFFKSFKDDEAAFDLFERKETQEYLETHYKLEEALAKRNLIERSMKAAVEKQQYREAHSMQAEIKALGDQIVQITADLKEIAATDEKRRNELRTLRTRTRAMRMDVKRAAEQQQFELAAEKQRQAELLQLECEALQAELKQTRRRPGSESSNGDVLDEFEDLSGNSLRGSTVRVSKFDPFSISVGKNELQVSLVDTPGYGDATNTEESFEVIQQYVESTFERQLQAESTWGVRDIERMRLEDSLVHVCLYFIAPHRLKHIDVAFMRRIHKLVNIVPIIAKSDTMTTKEKEEFKIQVREALLREGVEVFAFDKAIISKMEQQDKQEYKHPWAVVGSTDSHLEAGATVYLRKYPWGNALSSEPAHSDLPALRNLLMWSGQWHDLKLAARSKYEQWRATRSLAKRGSTVANAALRVAVNRATPYACKAKHAVDMAKDASIAACIRVGVPPRVAARALLVLLAALCVPVVGNAVAHKMERDATLPRQLALTQAQVSKLVDEKAHLVHSYEAQLAKLTQRLQVAEAHDELLRSTTKASQGEKSALAKSLRISESRIASLESSLQEAREKVAKEKEAKEKQEKEAKEKELKEAKDAKEKDAPKDGKGLPNLFGQLYSSSWNGGAKNENDTDKAPVPNAFAKVRQATSAAKGIANEVRGAAGSLLEAVKHGFESQPTV